MKAHVWWFQVEGSHYSCTICIVLKPCQGFCLKHDRECISSRTNYHMTWFIDKSLWDCDKSVLANVSLRATSSDPQGLEASVQSSCCFCAVWVLVVGCIESSGTQWSGTSTNDATSRHSGVLSLRTVLAVGCTDTTRRYLIRRTMNYSSDLIVYMLIIYSAIVRIVLVELHESPYSTRF